MFGQKITHQKTLNTFYDVRLAMNLFSKSGSYSFVQHPFLHFLVTQTWAGASKIYCKKRCTQWLPSINSFP